jgi:hypothetical protein
MRFLGERRLLGREIDAVEGLEESIVEFAGAHDLTDGSKQVGGAVHFVGVVHGDLVLVA